MSWLFPIWVYACIGFEIYISCQLMAIIYPTRSLFLHCTSDTRRLPFSPHTQLILDKTSDLKDFYPTTVLATSWDILCFWVARMVLLGIKLTGQMAFKDVFWHAMVWDAHCRNTQKRDRPGGGDR